MHLCMLNLSRKVFSKKLIEDGKGTNFKSLH